MARSCRIFIINSRAGKREEFLKTKSPERGGYRVMGFRAIGFKVIRSSSLGLSENLECFFLGGLAC